LSEVQKNEELVGELDKWGSGVVSCFC
jgi:hypothetical protein